MLIKRIDSRAMQLAVWVALSVVPYSLLLLPSWWDWLDHPPWNRSSFVILSPMAYLFFFKSTVTFFFKDDLSLILVHAVCALVMFWVAVVISVISFLILMLIESGIKDVYRVTNGAEIILFLGILAGAASVGLCLYWLQRNLLGAVGQLVGWRARLVHMGACALPPLLLVWHAIVSETAQPPDGDISADWHLWGFLTLSAAIHATITGVAHLLVPERINERPADPTKAEG